MGVGKGLVEVAGGGGDFVDVRRFEFVVTRASKGPGTLVIGDEYDNIGMILHDFL